MINESRFWSVIPSATQHLSALHEDLLEDGLTVVLDDPAVPSGRVTALQRELRDQGWMCKRVSASPNILPTQTIAGVYQLTPQLSAFFNSTLDDRLLVVEIESLNQVDSESWVTFLTRFRAERRIKESGLSILALLSNESAQVLKSSVNHPWSGVLRRSDSNIWADLHIRERISSLIESMVAGLAVELCGWRIDLISALAITPYHELIDPIGWLTSVSHKYPMISEPQRYGGRLMSCPLSCMSTSNTQELMRRIWRAQLSSIFPWLEERRQRFIEEYRHELVIDPHLASQGIESVDELEFGVLARQLKYSLRMRGKEKRADELSLYARVRNDIAHRRPARPEDVSLILNLSRYDEA